MPLSNCTEGIKQTEKFKTDHFEIPSVFHKLVDNIDETERVIYDNSNNSGSMVEVPPCGLFIKTKLQNKKYGKIVGETIQIRAPI